MIPIRVLHVDDELEHLEIARIFMVWEVRDDFERMNGLAFLEVVRLNSKYSDITLYLFLGYDGSRTCRGCVEELLLWASRFYGDL